VAFLLANWIGWEEAWPIFPMVAGIAFFGGYLAGGLKDGGMAFVGTGLFLTGLFFFGFTLGYWAWSDMAELWPVFPLIWGFAFLVLFLASRARDTGALILGLVGIIVGGVGLAYTYGLVEGDIVKFWPVLLILAGIVGLIGALARAGRRE
jgi:hypothetical protein